MKNEEALEKLEKAVKTLIEKWNVYSDFSDNFVLTDQPRIQMERSIDELKKLVEGKLDIEYSGEIKEEFKQGYRAFYRCVGFEENPHLARNKRFNYYLAGAQNPYVRLLNSDLWSQVWKEAKIDSDNNVIESFYVEEQSKK